MRVRVQALAQYSRHRTRAQTQESATVQAPGIDGRRQWSGAGGTDSSLHRLSEHGPKLEVCIVAFGTKLDWAG